MGYVCRDPEVRYTQSENATAFARYSLAVKRKYGQNGQDCDFINCVAFGKSAEFAEKYLHKGTKIAIAGRLQSGSYTNRDGVKIFTTDVVVEEQEFAEGKASQQENQAQSNQQSTSTDDFMQIPDDIQEELPFR